jgi:hypothetical protein
MGKLIFLIVVASCITYRFSAILIHCQALSAPSEGRRFHRTCPMAELIGENRDRQITGTRQDNRDRFNYSFMSDGQQDMKINLSRFFCIPPADPLLHRCFSIPLTMTDLRHGALWPQQRNVFRLYGHILDNIFSSFSKSQKSKGIVTF